MKKVTILAAIAMAAGLASCTAQSPKANLASDVDSLSLMPLVWLRQKVLTSISCNKVSILRRW